MYMYIYSKNFCADAVYIQRTLAISVIVLALSMSFRWSILTFRNLCRREREKTGRKKHQLEGYIYSCRESESFGITSLFCYM